MVILLFITVFSLLVYLIDPILVKPQPLHPSLLAGLVLGHYEMLLTATIYLFASQQEDGCGASCEHRDGFSVASMWAAILFDRPVRVACRAFDLRDELTRSPFNLVFITPI
jgi:hypothetical protein